MNRNILALIAGGTLLSLSACGGVSNTPKSIDIAQWKLESMNGKTNPAFAEGDAFTIQFMPTEKRIAGVGACNRFFGSYKLEEKNEVDINMGGSTRMACPNMDLEQPFFAMLDEADTYKIKKGKLYLYDDNKEIAVFTEYKTTPDMHNAENSLDIAGTYTGTLPAADCPGIKTTLVLNNDHTFALTSEYLERDSKFTDKGKYSVDGNILTLTTGDQTTRYKIGENTVTMLDGDGNEITGDLAPMFVLKK